MLTRGDKARLLRKTLSIMASPAPAPYDTDSLAAFDRGETMEAWSRRELGDRVHEYLVRPWVEPAFGVGTERLSVPFILGVLKRAYRARFAVPSTGIGDICDVFTRDVDVRTNVAVTKVSTNADGVEVEFGEGSISVDAAVVATDGDTAAAILGDRIDPHIAREMREAPYSTMVHATVGFARDPWPAAPYDMVLPVGPGEHPVVGIILLGRKSPNAVPAGGQAVDVYFNERFSSAATDDEVRARAVGAIEAMLGHAPAPAFVDVFRYERALALSPPGHYARMQTVRRSMPPHIRLAGDYLAHLGIETAVVTGERAALDIDRYFRAAREGRTRTKESRS